MISSVLREIASAGHPLVYVDCGARGEARHPLVDSIPGAVYVGFEPDPGECDRLRQSAPPGYRFFPIAVAAHAGQRMLHLTSNPACSSFLRPNVELWGEFAECAPQIEVVASRQVETASLDSFLPSVDVPRVDFLELDTQGSELEILHGARGLLASSVLAVRVEVEFSQMYVGQPLFADVDSYLRELGFVLFDLSRHRYRRKNFPPEARTRGQMLYGHALYFRAQADLARARKTGELANLATLAGFLGFHDYALEALGSAILTASDARRDDVAATLRRAHKDYLQVITVPVRRGRMTRSIRRVCGHRLVAGIRRLSSRVANACDPDLAQQNYTWSD